MSEAFSETNRYHNILWRKSQHVTSILRSLQIDQVTWSPYCFLAPQIASASQRNRCHHMPKPNTKASEVSQGAFGASFAPFLSILPSLRFLWILLTSLPLSALQVQSNKQVSTSCNSLQRSLVPNPNICRTCCIRSAHAPLQVGIGCQGLSVSCKVVKPWHDRIMQNTPSFVLSMEEMTQEHDTLVFGTLTSYIIRGSMVEQDELQFQSYNIFESTTHRFTFGSWHYKQWIQRCGSEWRRECKSNSSMLLDSNGSVAMQIQVEGRTQSYFPAH